MLLISVQLFDDIGDHEGIQAIAVNGNDTSQIVTGPYVGKSNVTPNTNFIRNW